MYLFKKKISLLILGLFASMTVSIYAYSDVEYDSWISVDSLSETSTPSAEALSKKLSSKLKSEKSKVIFLDVRSCDVLSHGNNRPAPEVSTDLEEEAPQKRNLKASNSDSPWCLSFQAALESSLIGQGIRFLPESSKNEIRQKISEEQVYQHNSMQVDVGKTVQMGKQSTLQAFVTVSVSDGGENVISILASSLNIKDGVVTISEKVTLKIKQTRDKTWGSVFKGLGIFGVGAGTTAACLINAGIEKKKSDAYFASYKAANTAEGATENRQRVEKHDNIATYYKVGAIVGGLITLYGIGHLYWGGVHETDTSYMLQANNLELPSWKSGPMLSQDFIGWGLEINFK